MRVLKLDFVTRPTLLQRGGLLLLLAALVLASYLAHLYVERTTALANEQAKLRGLQSLRQAAGELTGDQKNASERSDAELKLARRVMYTLSLPWDDLFSEIDASVDENVTLLRVEPDAEKRELSITAEAKDLAAMLAYGNRIAASARFQEAHVQSHQVQVQDPQRPVRFVMRAKWLVGPPSVAPQDEQE